MNTYAPLARLLLVLAFAAPLLRAESSVLPRMRTGVMAAAACCPKSPLRLAA